MVRRSGCPGMDHTDITIYTGIFKWFSKRTGTYSGNDCIAAACCICIYIYGNYKTGRQIRTAYTVLYIRVSDYGPKPKVGKHLVLDKGTNRQRSYTILNCEEEAGVYRISMERTRQ